MTFFAPDKKKRAAFLRAQKNVAEQNPQRRTSAIHGRTTGWDQAFLCK